MARVLTIATWDLGWLTVRPANDPALPKGVAPKRPEDIARLARYAAALHADIVAFQGVDNPQVAALLFPAASYRLTMTQSPMLQNSGFATARALSVTPEPEVSGLEPVQFSPRAYGAGGAAIGVTLSGGWTLHLLSVRLKSGCRDSRLDDASKPACAILGDQAEALGGWIFDRYMSRNPFLILGDFARVMDGDASFTGRLAGPGVLLRATEHYASPCWGGGNFVDHVFAGGAARVWLRPRSLSVLVYREQGEDWRERLSSHCPVSVQLDVPD